MINLCLKSHHYFFSIALALFLSSSLAWAASGDAYNSAELGPDPRRSYDLNISFGTLFPSKNGLREGVPGWILRASVPTLTGVFEAGLFSGIGNGIVYRSASLDYRMDLILDPVAAHFLIGFHGDQFSAETASSRFAGGWHYGGGITQFLAGPLLFRFDFRHRYSPGQAVEITLGLVYRLGSEQ
jgi:hypothetical protein